MGEYMLTGDVVKALQDLQYPATNSSGGLVRQGHMGTLQSSPLVDPLLIDWWGYKLGPASAAKSQVAKCHPREYLREGDVVKADHDLDYSNIGMQDAEGGWVREGSLGVIQGANEDHRHGHRHTHRHGHSVGIGIGIGIGMAELVRWWLVRSLVRSVADLFR